MFNTSKLEISKSALINNLTFIRQLLSPNVILSSVVKGNAYGHGIEVFVPLAESCGVKHFSVFSADEALRVSEVSNRNSTILIMGMLSNEALEWAITKEVEFFVFGLDRLYHALEIAGRLGKAAKVHIELETGMNRTGFPEENLETVANLLKKHSDLLIFQGLCTHFAGAESITNYYRVKKQKQRYNKILKWFKTKHNLVPILKHTACSAAVIRHPETHMDLVRVGILQYGFWPSPETFIEYTSHQKEKINPLKPLISWKSEVMNIKKVKTGDFIGYGTSYLASQDMTIAVVPVGYAHGFSRALSNQGRVLIKGERVSVLGIVNMNAMVINVTGIKNVQNGDEVVIIGKQGDMAISVASFSEFSNQVNYELLTRLPERLPRQLVD